MKVRFLADADLNKAIVTGVLRREVELAPLCLPIPSRQSSTARFPRTKSTATPNPAAIRDRFVSQVSEIVWKYKLAPETVNLPAKLSVQEIQVFEVALKTG